MSTVPPRRPQVDITVGEIRVVISDLGLVALHRGDRDLGEHLTLVRSEALTIARVLIERLAAGRVDDGTADAAHARLTEALQRKGDRDRAAGLSTCPRCCSVRHAADFSDEDGLLRVPLCSACRFWRRDYHSRAISARWWR